MGYGEGSVMKLPALCLVAATLAAGAVAAGCSEETFATVVSDASVADATSDASIADAGANVDAGPFCEGLTPAPSFCADFDDGEPAEFGWSMSNVKPTGSGSLTADTLESRSPPASLEVRNETTSGVSVQTFLSRTVVAPLSVKGATLDYDVFLEDITQASDVKLSVLVFDEPSVPGDYAVFFTVKPTGSVLEECMPPLADGGPTPYFVTSGVRNVLPKKWVHVAMAFDFTKPQPTVKVDLDGHPAIEERALAAGYLRQLTFLQVGIVYADLVKGPLSFRLDNVVLRIVP
jgi:hypothetical protein